MNFLIGGFLLVTFNAGFWWWTAYFIFVLLELLGLMANVYNRYTELKEKLALQLLL